MTTEEPSGVEVVVGINELLQSTDRSNQVVIVACQELIVEWRASTKALRNVDTKGKGET